MRARIGLVATSAGEIGRRGLRRRGLRVRFKCNEACTVSARLLAGRRAIATSTRRLAAADLGTLRLKPSRRGVAAIGERRRLKVALTATDRRGQREQIRVPRAPAVAAHRTVTAGGAGSTWRTSPP